MRCKGTVEKWNEQTKGEEKGFMEKASRNHCEMLNHIKTFTLKVFFLLTQMINFDNNYLSIDQAKL